MNTHTVQSVTLSTGNVWTGCTLQASGTQRVQREEAIQGVYTHINCISLVDSRVRSAERAPDTDKPTVDQVDTPCVEHGYT